MYTARERGTYKADREKKGVRKIREDNYRCYVWKQSIVILFNLRIAYYNNTRMHRSCLSPGAQTAAITTQ